ncbi:hypothetical protein [Kitasatospora sp. NPDC093558]|uniref:hypothetical protein n=1 Tax=Kitasatospora sp. NPDC093558 TaxID=3155201 RepID=UPI003447761F
MFELLPGTGVVLPHNAGVLRFGMSERAAQWAVATLADVRETWVCQAGWAFTACYEGLELLAYGDVIDRLSRTEYDVDGLAAVHLFRYGAGPSIPSVPSAVPVVLRDVDLFGYPAVEVLDALGPDPHPTVKLRPALDRAPAGYLREVGLLAQAVVWGG